MYWDASHERRIVCTISKRYERGDNQRYWYAYHPKWNDFLGEGKVGHFVLGCMDLDLGFMMPLEEIKKHLNALNTTVKDDDTMYWHIIIAERSKGRFELVLPKTSNYLDLKPFALRV